VKSVFLEFPAKRRLKVCLFVSTRAAMNVTIAAWRNSIEIAPLVQELWQGGIGEEQSFYNWSTAREKSKPIIQSARIASNKTAAPG
jgi:hypothetical protein